MADKVGASFPALEDMAKQLDLVNGRLTDLVEITTNISQQMQGGALIGIPGDNFVDALEFFRSKLVSLADEYKKEALIIRQEMSDLEAADQSAANSF